MSQGPLAHHWEDVLSNRTRFKRARLAAGVLAVGVSCVAVPAAQAAPVLLATASPFVVLGGSTVTNTGPSVLNGGLGVSPGTSLVGFGLPAVVNGAQHANDGVAAQAQLDLGAAYDVAAAEPSADMTGLDLGNRILLPGAYSYTSSAQLTGPLTLDAQGDPNAQFVFKIGTQLTTASASSVNLINGASPCNVFWQVATSAVLGAGTQFKGNVMALASISLEDAVVVQGRLLARNGQVSLINDVIDGSQCGTATPLPTPTGGTPTGGTPTGGTSPTTGNLPPGSQTTTSQAPRRAGTARLRRTPNESCTDGFHARVRGAMISRVVFRLDGHRISTRSSSPFSVFVRRLSGRHNVTARVTFTDATRARTLSLGYRACAAAVLAPRRGPSQFTG
jgi:hypothetical protein